MEVIALVLGVAILFNFVILRIKWRRKQHLDVIVDIGMLLILNAIFGGTILGAASATAGSTLISLYLIKNPISINIKRDNINSELEAIAANVDKVLGKRNI